MFRHPSLPSPPWPSSALRPSPNPWSPSPPTKKISTSWSTASRSPWDDKDLPRPYFRQITTTDGLQVSRNYPPTPWRTRATTIRQFFHPGAWLAFGDAAGSDFWRNKARVRHITFLAPPRTGKGAGTLHRDQRLRVHGRKAKDPLHGDLRLHHQSRQGRLYHPLPNPNSNRKAKPSTKRSEEMGFGVRLATPLSVKHGGGFIRNSIGEQEAGTWGQTRRLVRRLRKISATAEAGMSVMASPDNFRPSWFHSTGLRPHRRQPLRQKSHDRPQGQCRKTRQEHMPVDETSSKSVSASMCSARTAMANQICLVCTTRIWQHERPAPSSSHRLS